MFKTKNYNTIIEAAEAGGKQLKNFFGKQLDVLTKSTNADFRTQADVASEKSILEVLTLQFPSYNIQAEESGWQDKKSEFTFVIDPLDGTNNFVLGIPYFSTVIALLEGQKTIFGAIHNPILGLTYYAEQGSGAYLGQEKIQVNKVEEIKDATISYSANYLTPVKRYSSIINKLWQMSAKRVLKNWSPALDFCALASGKTEGIVNDNNELYDFLAGKLIAKEAGAKITDFSGQADYDDKNNIFIASNNTNIHQSLLEAVT